MAWIWLNKSEYPNFQNNTPNIKSDGYSTDYYCVADFKKDFTFKKPVRTVSLFVSADSFFMLFINKELLGIGPVAAGGDFLCKTPAPKHYLNKYIINNVPNEFNILARVRLMPQVLTDYSRGHGGFYLKGVIEYLDGTKETIETDSSWESRQNNDYCGIQKFNNKKPKNKWSKSQELNDIWNAQIPPIPMLSINKLTLMEKPLEVLGVKEIRLEFDKIYGVYPVIKANGPCRVVLKLSELEGQYESEETAVFQKPGEYISFKMHSAGTVFITVENKGEKAVEVLVEFLATWYPIEAEGSFISSNKGLNKVFDVCKHTLKICRQTMHLDSTKHQELLACTGDYYIESLMTCFCFGDMRLSEFDLMRTADMLLQNNGVLFHTSYSLIFVQMLFDTFMITGNKQLLRYCETALITLLDRFETYIGKNGIIDNPPDYMFVDWTVIDGFSMHHPPKCLGQTVLNAFYVKALDSAEKIFEYLENYDKKEYCAKKAKKVKQRINALLFDEDKQLYYDGLSDSETEKPPFRPKNISKRYFTKYSNILVCLYEIADEKRAKDILKRIVTNPDLPDIQPYFMHYLLSSLRKYNLFEEYGMTLLERWIPIVNECDKGLAEGWIAPEESYYFDHSHAWGGTPAFQLPKAVSGLEIIEPGMKKIRLIPNLYNLEFAKISIPTIYGKIQIDLEKGKSPKIKVPKEIEII